MVQGSIDRPAGGKVALEDGDFGDILGAEGNWFEFIDGGSDGGADFDVADAGQGQMRAEPAPFGRETYGGQLFIDALVELFQMGETCSDADPDDAGRGGRTETTDAAQFKLERFDLSGGLGSGGAYVVNDGIVHLAEKFQG